jgi:hypothetical protein
VFCPETLESRQLLSVAALQPTLGPIGNVPAAIGPVVPSPTINTGALGATPVIPIVLEFNPVTTGGNSFHNFVETILIIEEPVSSGLGTSAPTATGGSTSTSGMGNASSPTPASQNGPAPAITPLTATILAGPGNNRAAIIAIVTQPTVVTNFTSSSIPVTTLSILATAALEEQPIQPPVLGQGFESGQTQGGDPQAEKGLNLPKALVPFEPKVPAFDYIEPYRAEPANPPAVQPAQPAEPPAAPAPAPIKVEPVDTLPVEPIAITEVNRSPEFPILPPQDDAMAEAATPSWSLAAAIGTAAIAGGGYHLVLGGSNRFNQRWLPTLRSASENRSRKPVRV